MCYRLSAIGYRLSAIGYLLAFLLVSSCSNQQTGDLSANSDPILTQLTSFFNNSCVGTIPQNLTSGAEFCIATNKAAASNKDSLGKLYTDDGKTYYYQTEALYSDLGKLAYKSISPNSNITVWYLKLTGALISNETMMNADTVVISYDAEKKTLNGYYYSSFTQNQYPVFNLQVTSTTVDSVAQQAIGALAARIKDMPRRYSIAIPTFMKNIESKGCYLIYKLQNIPYCSLLHSAGGAVDGNFQKSDGVIRSMDGINTEVYLPAYNATYTTNLNGQAQLAPNSYNQVWYYTVNSPYGPPYEVANENYLYYVFDSVNVTLSEWYFDLSGSQPTNYAVVLGYPVQPLAAASNVTTKNAHARLAMTSMQGLTPAGIAGVTIGSVVGGVVITLLVMATFETAILDSMNAASLAVYDAMYAEAALPGNTGALASLNDAIVATTRYILSANRALTPASLAGDVAEAVDAQESSIEFTSAAEAALEAELAEASAL